MCLYIYIKFNADRGYTTLEFQNVFWGSTRKLHLWKWMLVFPFSFSPQSSAGTSASSKRGQATGPMSNSILASGR